MIIMMIVMMTMTINKNLIVLLTSSVELTGQGVGFEGSFFMFRVVLILYSAAPIFDSE